jgi:sensor histidine kinase YesM
MEIDLRIFLIFEGKIENRNFSNSTFSREVYKLLKTLVMVFLFFYTLIYLMGSNLIADVSTSPFRYTTFGRTTLDE